MQCKLIGYKRLAVLQHPNTSLAAPFHPAGQMVERLSIDKVRFFRVERTYAVKTGKWYFEFEAVTGGDMRVGWARPGCKPDVELGTDELAFVFDGYRVSRPLDT